MKKPSFAKLPTPSSESASWCHLLEALPEREFQDIVRLAVQISDTTQAIVHFLDSRGEWICKPGTTLVHGFGRERTFWSSVLAHPGVLVVEDVLQNSSFGTRPLRLGDCRILFYAGVALRTSDGLVAGVLSVADTRPRTLSGAQSGALEALARLLISQLEGRRKWVRQEESERKQVEETLRRTEILYRRAIAAANCVPYLRDYRTETFAHIGEEIEVLTGYKPSELTVEIWDSLVQAYYLRGELAGLEVTEAIRKVRAGEVQQWQADIRIRTRDGQTRWLADASVEILENGRSIGSIGALQDITARKSAEEQLRQLQKMESVGKLAGGVAHDFNNILTVIQGYCNLLQLENHLPSKDIESLRQIALAAERAAGLTKQLLAFSRKQLMRPATLSLNEVVGQMTRMLHRILGEDIVLQFSWEGDAPPIRADAGMIEQVLMNLAVNARDAMPQGGRLVIQTTALTVDIEYLHRHPEARLGEFVCLSVTDSGTGIAPEVLPHIFEPFFTTKDVGKGTGLGLATVYGIVAQHQGWIEVSSQLGHGTSFKVCLPAAARTNDSDEATDEPIPVRGGHETVLLVEDEAGVRSLLGNVLRHHGYQVFEAVSGKSALQVWSEHHAQIDLLLTDMVMPDGLSGGELARRLVSEKPQLKVIYTTGYSDELLVRDFDLREGVNFLPKPYHPDQLARTVRDCLDQTESVSVPS